METAFIFLVMILILVILGFGGYFVYDYVQYKKNLESELEDTKKNIVSTKTEIQTKKKHVWEILNTLSTKSMKPIWIFITPFQVMPLKHEALPMH